MYLGDFDFGSTVFFKFTTVGTSGAVVALSSGGVTVYRDGSTVQDATGVTLTASFDGRTGFNAVQIDMSSTGYYSSAASFTAIISSGAGAEDMAGYVLREWSLRDRSVLSTAGIETLSSAGLETLSSAGLETVSTVGITTLSSAGLETLSSAGLETVSTVGLTTLSTLGLETFSTAKAQNAANAALVANNLDHLLLVEGSSLHVTDKSIFAKLVSAGATAAWADFKSTTDSLEALRNRGDAAWATVSTAGLETLSSAGLETLSSAGLETLSTLGITTLSSAGLETLSTLGITTLSSAGLETASSLVDVAYFSGSSLAVENIAKTGAAIARITVGTGSSSTAIVASAVVPAVIVPDQFKGRVGTFDANTVTTALRGQSFIVSGNSTVSSPVFDSTDALTTAPASGDLFSLT